VTRVTEAAGQTGALVPAVGDGHHGAVSIVLVVAAATLLGLVLILAIGMGERRSPASPAMGGGEERHDLDWVREGGVEGLDKLLRMLFSEMGFAPESGHRGRSSVDFQALDPTPIRGGRVHVHGVLDAGGEGIDGDDVRAAVDAARADLAGKAVLVTLGRFTPDARDAARDQPVDLVDGEALVALVRKYLPQAWATRVL